MAGIEVSGRITALPWSAGAISAHFSRADTIVLLTEDGQVVEHFPNPATYGQCVGKNALINTLQQKNVARVLVRNIGQHMLETLLQLSVEVYRVPRGFLPQGSPLDALQRFERLEHARQGKASPHCRMPR